MFALQHSDGLPFREPSHADAAVLICLPHLHLFHLVYVEADPHQIFLQDVLLHLESHRVLQHQSMKLLWSHARYGRVLWRILPIVVCLSYLRPLVLPIDKVEVILSVRVVLDGPIVHAQ